MALETDQNIVGTYFLISKRVQGGSPANRGLAPLARFWPDPTRLWYIKSNLLILDFGVYWFYKIVTFIVLNEIVWESYVRLCWVDRCSRDFVSIRTGRGLRMVSWDDVVLSWRCEAFLWRYNELLRNFTSLIRPTHCRWLAKYSMNYCIFHSVLKLIWKLYIIKYNFKFKKTRCIIFKIKNRTFINEEV